MTPLENQDNPKSNIYDDRIKRSKIELCLHKRNFDHNIIIYSFKFRKVFGTTEKTGQSNEF